MDATPRQQIDGFRQEFLRELPLLAREYVDVARSEGTTAAYEKVMNTALKVIEGLQVQEKKDPYANLPVINITFGPGMQLATQVEPAPLPEPQVQDVQPKVASPFASSSSAAFGTLPDDPVDLLPAPADPESAEVLAALDLAANAMVLD